jgi:hypothetical protein
VDDFFVGTTASFSPAQPASAVPAPPQPMPPVQQQPQPWGAPAWGAPAWGAPGWGPVAPAPRSKATTFLIVAAAVLVTLVVMGILAAIAIPVFLNQRAKAAAAAVSVELPATFQGMPQVHDQLSAAVEDPFLNAPAPGRHVAATYAQGSNRVTVAVGTYRLSPADQRNYLAGAEGAMLEAVPSLEFAPVATGRYRGTFECARLAGRTRDVTTCFWADAGSYGLIQVYGQGGVPLAREVRAAVETVR